MAIVDVAIAPLGLGDTSLSRYVAEALKTIKAEKGIKYELNSMGTCLEGDLGQIFALIQKINEAVFAMGAKRTYLVIKVDDRRDKETSMAYKMESVNKKLT